MKCNAELRGGYSYLHGVLQMAVQPFAARQTVRRLLAVEAAATLRRPASPSWFSHLLHGAENMPANAMPISATPEGFALDDAMSAYSKSALSAATEQHQRNEPSVVPEAASNPASAIDGGRSSRMRSLAQTITESKSSRVLDGEMPGSPVEDCKKQSGFPAKASAQSEQVQAAAATSPQALLTAHAPMRLQKSLHALMQSLQQHNFPPASVAHEPSPNASKADSPSPDVETSLYPSVQSSSSVISSGYRAVAATLPTVTMLTSPRPASNYVDTFSGEQSETDLPLAVLDIPAWPASIASAQTFASILNPSPHISADQAPSAVQRLVTAHDKSTASAGTEPASASASFSKSQQESASQTTSAKRGAPPKRPRQAITPAAAAPGPVTAARQMPSRFWQRSHMAQLRLLLLK